MKTVVGCKGRLNAHFNQFLILCHRSVPYLLIGVYLKLAILYELKILSIEHFDLHLKGEGS